jgi:oligopeptide/dipeptide ABC transporter ATP-binding protein
VSAPEYVVEVEDLSIEYRQVGSINKAVNHATFNVKRGEVVGIVGESGSGKSSAVLGVLGLTRRSGTIVGGSVTFEGQKLYTASPDGMNGLSDEEWRSIRGSKIGLVTQNPRGALNPVMRLGEQLTTMYQAHREATDEEARARAIELLEIVGINDPVRRLRAFPHELSGGMAQRVLIAMSLACSPRLLIADEPTSGLDVTVQAQVLDDLRHAVDEVGSSLLVVTQNLSIVANYCDRVYVVHAGEIVEEAPTLRFFEQPSFPASAALLAAQRGIADPALQLTGFPVDGRQLPSGCYLHQRCPFSKAEDGCTTVHPDFVEVVPGHFSRCHRTATVTETVRTRLLGVEAKGH